MRLLCVLLHFLVVLNTICEQWQKKVCKNVGNVFDCENYHTMVLVCFTHARIVRFRILQQLLTFAKTIIMYTLLYF